MTRRADTGCRVTGTSAGRGATDAQHHVVRAALRHAEVIARPTRLHRARSHHSRARARGFGLDDGLVDLGAAASAAPTTITCSPRAPASGTASTSDFVEGAAHDLLVALGDLTHDGDRAPRTTHGAQVGKCRADPVRRLEQHDGGVRGRDRRETFGAGAALARAGTPRNGSGQWEDPTARARPAPRSARARLRPRSPPRRRRAREARPGPRCRASPRRSRRRRARRRWIASTMRRRLGPFVVPVHGAQTGPRRDTDRAGTAHGSGACPRPRSCRRCAVLRPRAVTDRRGSRSVSPPTRAPDAATPQAVIPSPRRRRRAANPNARTRPRAPRSRSRSATPDARADGAAGSSCGSTKP